MKVLWILSPYIHFLKYGGPTVFAFIAINTKQLEMRRIRWLNCQNFHALKHKQSTMCELSWRLLINRLSITYQIEFRRPRICTLGNSQKLAWTGQQIVTISIECFTNTHISQKIATYGIKCICFEKMLKFLFHCRFKKTQPILYTNLVIANYLSKTRNPFAKLTPLLNNKF